MMRHPTLISKKMPIRRRMGPIVPSRLPPITDHHRCDGPTKMPKSTAKVDHIPQATHTNQEHSHVILTATTDKPGPLPYQITSPKYLIERTVFTEMKPRLHYDVSNSLAHNWCEHQVHTNSNSDQAQPRDHRKHIRNRYTIIKYNMKRQVALKQYTRALSRTRAADKRQRPGVTAPGPRLFYAAL